MQTVYELSVARPHEARPRGYTRAEWPLYVEGYEHAILIALRALLAARDRFALAERHRWHAARAKCRAERASAELRQLHDRQVARVQGDHAAEKIVQRGQRVDWKHEGKTLLAGAVVTDDDALVGSGGALDGQIEPGKPRRLRHAGKYVTEQHTGKLGSEKENTSTRDGDRPAAAASEPVARRGRPQR